MSLPYLLSILSVRELRTLLSRVGNLPLDLQTVNSFEDLLRQCDKQYNGTRPSVDPIEFETHYDPDLVGVSLSCEKGSDCDFVASTLCCYGNCKYSVSNSRHRVPWP